MTTRDATNRSPSTEVPPVHLSANVALVLADPPDGLTKEDFDIAGALDLLARMHHAITEAPDLHAQHQAAAVSSALHALLDKIERGSALANAASALMLTAERRLGQRLSALERTPGRGNDERSEYQLALDMMGVRPRTARHWRQVAAVPEDVFTKYTGPAIDRATTGQPSDRIVSRSGLLRCHRENAAGTVDVSQILASDVTLREAAQRSLGGVDMVPAPGSDVAEWNGRVLLAPTDADAEAWAHASATGWSEGRIEKALLHLPFRLEATWWSLLAEHPVCLLRPEAIARRTQTAGIIFGLGVSGVQLAEAFGELGRTYAPVGR